MQIDRSYAREKVLGEHVRAIAADLRMIELADFVTYLRSAQYASVGALVQASIELSFKPETLLFSYSGDVSLEWCGRTQLALDMEFHHQAVHVYFRLLLEAHEAAVEILSIKFDENNGNPEENTRRLGQALCAARIN